VARRLAVAVANAANVAPLAYRQDTPGGPLARLASIGTVGARDVRYTADGAYLAISTTSNFAVHRRDGDTHPMLTRTTNISAAGQGTAWHADGQRLVFTYSSANRLYPFLRTGDAYSYVGAVTNVTGNAQPRAVEWGGDLLAFGVSAAPWIQTYRADAAGMLTKLPNPSVTPSAVVASVAWAPPDCSILALASNTTPGTLVRYAVSGDTRTRLTPDISLPGTARAFSLSFSPDGTRLAVGTNAAPYLRYYAHDGAGGLTALPDPVDQPAGFAYSVAFTPDNGDQLAVASFAAPYLLLYSHDGDGLTLIPDAVAEPPTVEAVALSWTPDDAPPTGGEEEPPVQDLGSAGLGGTGGLTGSVRGVADLGGVALGGSGGLAGRVRAVAPLSGSLGGSGGLEGRVRGGTTSELRGTTGSAYALSRTGSAFTVTRTGSAHL
jgi:hypothetical protein